MEARVVDHTHRLPEPHNDRLAGLVDREHRAERDDDADKDDGGDCAADDT
jgi:hypothetical protein